MAEQTVVILSDAAAEIVKDVHQAAQQEAFVAFTNLSEAVRLRCLGSLIDLTGAYCQVVAYEQGEDSCHPLPGAALSRMDFLEEYADAEVRRHRALSIKLGDFLILLKHYRQSFQRVLDSKQAEDMASKTLVDAMFDALEIACGGAWARQSHEDHSDVIQQREAYWLKVFEAVNDAVMIHDADSGQVLYANDAATKMYGASKEDLLAEPAGQFSAGGPAVDKEKIVNKIQSAVSDGAQHFEWQAKHKDGRIFWVDVGLSHMNSAEKDYVIAVIRDIDAQKQAKEQERHSHHKEHEAQRLESLGLLAGGIAHDFNNLLTSIMGNAELMRLSEHVDADSASCLDSIEKASDKAADLCQQMLHFAGTGLVNKGAQSVARLVQDSLDEIRQLSEIKIPIQVEVESGLPDILIDRSQFSHVLINLLLNAVESVVDVEQAKILVKARIHQCDSDCAGLRGTLKSGLHAEHARGQYLCIGVEDNGCGMQPETQEKIFEPFFSTKFFGRGLGLAAVAGIARSYKGFVGVKSQQGQGSTVSLYLPLSEIAPGFRSAQNNANTILLIDDDGEVRSVASRMLKMMNFEVLLAENGERGLQVFAEHRTSICGVLTDLSMPVLDGVETVRRIFALSPKLPVLMMSGFDATRAAQRFGGETPVEFIQKPFSFNRLKELLQKVMGRQIE